MDADLLVVNGRLFRSRGAVPTSSATALAIVAGRIAWLGEDTEALRDWRGARTEVVDAKGGLVMPGFEDAHTHLLHGARGLDRLDLLRLESLDAIQSAVRAWADSHPADAWVIGHRWLYGAIPAGLPTREQLDVVVGDRPAYLECFDGHTGWANSAALRAAGIDRDTPDPPGGEIVRDVRGEPTGALKENAAELLERALPPPDATRDLAGMRRAIALHHAAGITAVQEAGVATDELPLWLQLAGDGDLTLRARLAFPMTPDGTLEQWRERLDELDSLAVSLRNDTWLSTGILKAYNDGVIETKTAAMLEPYAGDTAAGKLDWEARALNGHVAEADRRGWQVEIHAVGDRAVRMALDAFELVGPRRRHRVEHIETIDPADIPRFARLGVVASFQPYHADPAPGQSRVWLSNVGPDRAQRAWAWRSILDAGGTLAFGSDWPVVPFDPMIGVNAAVTRQTVDGEPAGGSLPGERLSVAQALEAYTLGAAFAAHADARRGSLARGKDADVTVLDRDLLAGGASAIIGTGVRLTVVGGRVVHRRENAS